MGGLLEKIVPEVWRVYAAALAHKRTLGEWPSRETIVELAKTEGASVGACLVLTRFELASKDGKPVPLDGDRALHPPVVVHDAQTLRAIAAQPWGVTAILKAYCGGGEIKKRNIEYTAEGWETEP